MGCPLQGAQQKSLGLFRRPLVTSAPTAGLLTSRPTCNVKSFDGGPVALFSNLTIYEGPVFGQVLAVSLHLEVRPGKA
jgi:hypothetical protein